MNSETPIQNSNRSNPFVFIFGCPRSGTTLLKRIVNAHPEIAIPPESNWIPKFHRHRYGLTQDGHVKREFIDHLVANRRFARMKISRAELEELLPDGRVITYANYVGRIYDEYGRKQGKALVGDKTPAYGQHIQLLHGLWPTAKFIHLVRDGRDVSLSMLNWRKAEKNMSGFACWRSDPVMTIAAWWRYRVLRSIRLAESLPSNYYLDVRFESLIHNFKETCQGLCEFLKVPHARAMVDFNAGRINSVTGLSANKAWLSPTPGLRDWRTQMESKKIEQFEAVAGDLLEQLGYPRHVAAISSQSLERAAEIKRIITQRQRPIESDKL